MLKTDINSPTGLHRRILTLFLVLLSFFINIVCASDSSLQQGIKKAQDMLQKGEIAKSLFMAKSLINAPNKNNVIYPSRVDSISFVNIYGIIGKAYLQLRDYSQSFYYHQLALDLAQTLHSSNCEADAYNNLAVLFYSQKKRLQAEKYLNLALAINLKNKRNAQAKQNYNNLGVVYFENHDYKKALYFLDKSFKNTSPHDILDRSLILTNMSQIYYDTGDYNTALSTLESARALQTKVPFSPDMLQTELNYMMALIRTGQQSKVKPMIKRIAATIKSVNDPSVKFNSYEYLADVCFAMKDSLQGLRYILKYVSLRDSIQNNTDNKQLEQYRQLYDLELLRKKNINLSQSLNILKLKAERRKLLFAIGISFSLVIAILLLWILRQRERLRKYEYLSFRKQERTMAEEIDYKNRQLTSYTLEQAAGNTLSQSIV
jgi:tetratricopeptide (TPR) repeat protein